jgi:hypothetical protein
MNVGDRIRVKIRNGGVQEGRAVEVRADSVVWDNDCNFRRTSLLSSVTTLPVKEAVLSAYVQDWIDNPGE